MIKDILQAKGLIYTSYNTYEGNLSTYEFTLFNLFNIYGRAVAFHKNIAIENLRGQKLHQEILDIYRKAIDESESNEYKQDSDTAREIFENNYFKNIGETIEDFMRREGFEMVKSIFDEFDFELLFKNRLTFADDCIQYYLDAKKEKSDALQPQELTQLMQYFLPKSEDITVYNPFSGMGSLGIGLSKECKYIGEELDNELVSISNFRYLLYEQEKFEIKQNDALNSLRYGESKYDSIIFNPPLNASLSDSMRYLYVNQPEMAVTPLILELKKRVGKLKQFDFLFAAMLLSIERLKKDGKLICVVPDSFLLSKDRKISALRKNLVDYRHLSHLIKLPANLFSFTSISLNILVLENKALDEVTFIDASEMVKTGKGKKKNLDLERITQVLDSDKEGKFSKQVSFDEIAKKKYQLNVKRYVREELNLTSEQASQLRSLKSVVFSGLPNWSKPSKANGKYIKYRDLSDNDLEFEKNFEDLEDIPLRTSDARLLETDCLLVSLAYNDLKPTLYQKADIDIFYPPSYILPIHPNSEEIELEYLVLELRKKYVKIQLDSLRSSSGISRISKSDFLDVKIVVPSKSEQVKEVLRVKNAIVEEKRRDFNDLMKSYGIDVADENSLLRHQIAGTLKNVRSTIKAIQDIVNGQIVEKYPEILRLKRNIRIKNTFEDYLSILDRDTSNIQKAVLGAGKEISLTQMKLKPLNLIEFIESYAEELQERSNQRYQLDLAMDYDFLEENNIKEITIQGDNEFLRRAFDNIVENAVKHGFRDLPNNQNRIEILAMYDLEQMEVQIDFGNTGHPLPKDFTYEKLTRRGSSFGVNSGDGTGGWFIQQVMKLHNGSFGYTDETGPEGVGSDIVTSMELIFPIELKLK